MAAVLLEFEEEEGILGVELGDDTLSTVSGGGASCSCGSPTVEVEDEICELTDERGVISAGGTVLVGVWGSVEAIVAAGADDAPFSGLGPAPDKEACDEAVKFAGDSTTALSRIGGLV